MARNICLVPYHWTSEDVAQHRCSDGSHLHLSFKERRALLKAGLVEGMTVPHIIRFKRHIRLRDLSVRYGPELAEAVRSGKPWAEVLLEQIRGQIREGRID